MGYSISASSGKRFVYKGDVYILGIAEDDIGMRTCAIFKQTGSGWLAQIPVLDDNVTSDKVMAYGNVNGYINAMLPKATYQLQQMFLPKKPDMADKAMCVAYDLALDVDFNETTCSFALNKQPPLSHAG